MATTGSELKEVKIMLPATNPEYDANLSEWLLYRDVFLGGTSIISGGHLFKHARETDEAFALRKKRSYFINFCNPIIAVYAGFLVLSSVNRDLSALGAKKALFDEFMGDVTKDSDRKNFKAFMLEVTSWAAAQGVCPVVVDRPVATAPIATAADEQAQGIKTYARRIPRENVLDWAYAEDGELLWVKLKEDSFDPRESFQWTSFPKSRWRILYRDRWEVWQQEDKDTFNMVANGPNPILRVPIVFFRWPDGSLLKDAARVNRGIYNWCSLLDEQLYNQTFPQLVVPDDGDTSVTEIKIGPANALTFNANTPTAKPEYICPPSAPSDTLQNQIEGGINTIKRMLLSKGDTDGVQAESGIAKAYDFSQLNNTLANASQSMGSGEEALIRLWAAWEGINIPVGQGLSVKYPDAFDVQALTDSIDNAVKLQTVKMGSMFDRYLKKRLARQFIDQRDTQDLSQVIAEIDSGETDAAAMPDIPAEGAFNAGAAPGKTPVAEPETPAEPTPAE